jgi:hypothetical protein
MKNLIFAQVLALALSCTAALADVVVTANRGARDDSFITVVSEPIRTSLEAGKGYSCIMLNREADAAAPKQFLVFNPLVTRPDNLTFIAATTGAIKPGIAVPSSLVGSQANLRLSFIAPLTGNYTFTATNAQPGGAAVPGSTVRCTDTSLYGSYNRLFADLAIVEITNDTESRITPFITIVDSNRNVVVNAQQVNDSIGTGIAGNSRQDVIFTNLPAGTYGQIIITHAASLGSINAYVSEYDFRDNVLDLKRERPMESTPILP